MVRKFLYFLDLTTKDQLVKCDICGNKTEDTISIDLGDNSCNECDNYELEEFDNNKELENN